MDCTFVLGMQWGDEGKGKIVDVLSSDFAHIVRSQGGNNAGHTVIADGVEYKFHLIPSGIIYPHTTCYIAGGTVIEPEALLKEIADAENMGLQIVGRLKISPFAHVVFPYHKSQDQDEERKRGGSKIGTTGRGIGPCYTDRTKRCGIRVGDLFDANRCREVFQEKGVDVQGLLKLSLSYGERLKSFVLPVEDTIQNITEKMLIEGAQGALLDIVYGTYPYVTSSQTISGGVCGGAALFPSNGSRVVGIAKAYTTRVGSGPFPSEMSSEESDFFEHEMMREFGTTTGRKRRIGWLDLPLLKWACRVNGITELAVTKLDILSSLETIRVCVGYMRDGKEISVTESFFGTSDAVTPIYEEVDGWKISVDSSEKLPSDLEGYIHMIENYCDVPVSIISYGPEREKVLRR